MFVFSTYLPMLLLKFLSGELIGCISKSNIQCIATRHTFDGPHYPKNNKYLKTCDDDIIITFFQVFIVFGVAGLVKSMSSGYSLDANLISHPGSSPDRNLSKNTGRYVKNTNKKVVFSFLPPKLINIFLLFSLGGPF